MVQHEEMENILVDNFHILLFELDHDKFESIQCITRHIPHLVRRYQNMELMETITMEEVEEVVKGMARKKFQD